MLTFAHARFAALAVGALGLILSTAGPADALDKCKAKIKGKDSTIEVAVDARGVLEGARDVGGRVPPPKRPADVVGTTIKVAKIATGEIEEDTGEGPARAEE